MCVCVVMLVYDIELQRFRGLKLKNIMTVLEWTF